MKPIQTAAVDYYEHLVAVASDPKIINSDGTGVDPLVEVAAWVNGVAVKDVTLLQRNNTMQYLISAKKMQNEASFVQQRAAQQQAWQGFMGSKYHN